MNKEELYKTILNSPTHKYALLNEIYAIRNKSLEKEDYMIAVNGFVSVDVLLDNYNLINEKQRLIKFLEDKIKENEGIIQMSMGSLNEEFFDRKVQEEIREKLRSVIKECENKIDAFQEVLDFVNKGGKDE